MAVSKRLRYEVLKRDGHACRYCGGTAPDVKLTIDHVVPTTLGGDDDPSNLVTACSDCNSGKSSSNPDAPLVANVAEDALRWAEAQQTAAERMLADVGRRRENARRFKVQWDSWTFSGRAVELPTGWDGSVDNFLAAGLPMEVLLDCVTKAMAKQRIRTDEIFRYMCGIAWARVRELNDAAKSIVARAPAPPKTEHQYKQAISLLYGYINGIEDPAQRALWAESFDENHDEDEDEHGNLVDYSGWDQDVKALVRAVADRTERADSYEWTIRDIVNMVPENERQEFLAQSWHSHEMAGDPYTAEDVARYAMVLVFRKHYPAPRTEGAWF